MIVSHFCDTRNYHNVICQIIFFSFILIKKINAFVMDHISQELIDLNDYFEAAVNMIPDYSEREKSTPKKRSRDSSKSTGPKSKKPKVNSHLVKAMNKFNRMSQINDEDDEEFIAKKKSLMKGDSSCSIDELHQRLQNKIEELKKQREPKNPEKRARKKKKDKKLRVAKDKSAEKVAIVNTENTPPIVDNEQSNSESIVTKEGKVVFSKFDFSQMVGKYSTNKKTKKNKAPSSKNYELLLLKAAKEKERIERIKKEDPKKACQIIEKSTWNKAMAKAEGEKVRDDPTLLKKSLKRKVAKKKKSSREWKARTETVEENMRKRQEKKKANVQKRKEFIRNKKAFKRAKKMPGF